MQIDERTIGRGLPYIYGRICEGLFRRSTPDDAVHVHKFSVARCVEADGFSVLPVWCVVSKERPKNSALCCYICGFSRFFVSNFIHKPGSL